MKNDLSMMMDEIIAGVYSMLGQIEQVRRRNGEAAGLVESLDPEDDPMLERIRANGDGSERITRSQYDIASVFHARESGRAEHMERVALALDSLLESLEEIAPLLCSYARERADIQLYVANELHGLRLEYREQCVSDAEEAEAYSHTVEGMEQRIGLLQAKLDAAHQEKKVWDQEF